MSSGTNILVTVDVSDPSKFQLPIPVNDEKIERENTVFHLLAEDNGISILGTYDQILNWVAEIGQKMMSWPIVTGHHEWFGEAQNNGQKEAASVSNASNDER